MTNVAENVLKQMYDEYLRTNDADWMNINTSIGKQLETLGYVQSNILGEFKLTGAGIAYMSM